jgi:thioredoxin-related protein
VGIDNANVGFHKITFIMKTLLYFIAIIPLFVNAQEKSIAGLWKLEEKRSLSGFNYENGIPTLIKVVCSEEVIKLEMTSSFKDRDTTVVDILSPLGDTIRSITNTKRCKKEQLVWDKINQQWIKYTGLSAKEDSAITKIETTDALKLSTTGAELLLIRKYNNHDVSGGNQDYTMQGLYKKVSLAEFQKETAKGNGIHFVEGLTWEQILNKAKKENKKIFVDCYATWCAPCKKMDKDVYNLNIVGDEVSAKFISVKVQMDTAKNDDLNVKVTYPIARKFEREYNINVLPTFLFFDQSGNAVHKATGASDVQKFIKLLHDVDSPSLQMYNQFRKGISGQLSYPEMASLAVLLLRKGERNMAKELARKYLEEYVFSLKEEKMFSKENIEFVGKFSDTIQSSDRIFRVCLASPDKADSMSGVFKGFSSELVKYVIAREEINPFIVKAYNSGKSPDWTGIEKAIINKYGNKYATTVIVNAKTTWYKGKKEWDSYIQNLVIQIESNGDLTKMNWLNLNGAAWDIFKYCNDPKLLEKGLSWAQIAINNQSSDTSIKDAPWTILLDTYANLLYKLGKKEEAIEFYKKEILTKGVQAIEFYDTYVKMYNGLSTWSNISD